MFLFIFESIGTSELLLVGIVALIFLGPRRLPDLARKAGKMMAEFRGTANEFKETWQREVNFEEEAKALDINALEADSSVQRADTEQASATATEPEIKEIDPAKFEHLAAKAQAEKNNSSTSVSTTTDANNKENWL